MAIEPCLRPLAGPMYWDWRCLRCDQDIAAHPRLFVRLWRRIRAHFGASEQGSDSTTQGQL